MKRFYVLSLFLIPIIAACTSIHPIDEVVAASDGWDNKTLSMRGYLCVDLLTVYLASTNECDQAKEEREGGFRVPLTLTQTQFSQVETYKKAVPIVVTGLFRAPPTGAIRMERGILPGYTIHVSSIKILEP